MMATFNSLPPVPWFTPRLLEGPEIAPRVMFLDRVPESPQSIADRVAQALESDGEAIFAIHRYAVLEGYRRLGKNCSALELPEYGAPEVIPTTKYLVHSVFAATFPPAWLTGQVRTYALSSRQPTVRLGMKAHRWLADLGPLESNSLLWSQNGF